jgi:hypothetical protein
VTLYGNTSKDLFGDFQIDPFSDRESTFMQILTLTRLKTIKEANMENTSGKLIKKSMKSWILCQK